MTGEDKGSFRLLRAANCGKVNIWEETNGVTFVWGFLWCRLWADKSLEHLQ